MAGPPLGYLSFPGIRNVISWSFTVNQGIQPDIASLRITPQDEDIPTTPQTMSILFGDIQFDFVGCIVDRASIHSDPGSPSIVCVSIKNRKWAWQYGEITGHYNLRFSDGTIDLATQKTTQQLAGLLLDAMGEFNYDVSAMSTLPYPEADWDYANPAQELEELAESLGCRVVLRLDGSVMVALVGQGSDLPDSPFARTIDFGIDPPDKPDSVKVVGGPTRYQTTFRLRAVGQEKDTLINANYDNQTPRRLIGGDLVAHGAILPIENLSYAPKPGTFNGGWQGEWMSGRSFANIKDQSTGKTDLEAIKKAQETVYRWYQIQETADQSGTGLCNILGYNGPNGSLVYPWQCMPLEDGLVETYVESLAVTGVPPTGQYTEAEHPLAAVVRGKWHQENPDFGTNDTFRDFPYGFQLDRERGIVKLPFATVRLNPSDPTNPFLPAELYLTIAHSVKDYNTRQPDRFTLSLDLGDPLGTGPLILRREDVVRRVISGTTLSDMTMTANPTGLSDTQDSAAQEANYYLSAFVASLQTPQTSHAEFNGILYISPDGRINQVEWSGGPGGAMTKASCNTEFSLHVPSYQERREIGRVRRQIQQSKVSRGQLRRMRGKRIP